MEEEEPLLLWMRVFVMCAKSDWYVSCSEFMIPKVWW